MDVTPLVRWYYPMEILRQDAELPDLVDGALFTGVPYDGCILQSFSNRFAVTLGLDV